VSPTRDRPARNLQGLERWISEWATELSEPAGRLRHRLAVLTLSAMLDTCTDNSDGPLFALKGGSALEVRYSTAARVSRDVDLVFRGAIGDAISSISDATARGWSGFTGRVRDPQPLSIPWASVERLRLPVQLSYLGKPYVTLSLEIVISQVCESEAVASISLGPVGLDSPNTVPCLSLRYQVAEKLHACTVTLDGERINDRVGDVMDLILIEDLSGDGGYIPRQVRAACVEVFEQRSLHPWPPVLTVQPTWRTLWSNLVDDNGFHITSIDEAVARVNGLIGTIDAAT
jgi:hypothetical protein